LVKIRNDNVVSILTTPPIHHQSILYCSRRETYYYKKLRMRCSTSWATVAL